MRRYHFGWNRKKVHGARRTRMLFLGGRDSGGADLSYAGDALRMLFEYGYGKWFM